jgi:hypothetical protein
VGILETLNRWLSSAPAGTGPATDVGIRSPWTGPSHLATIVWADILGTENAPVSRAEAMGVPAIARGRHLLTNDASRCPLSTYPAGSDVPQGDAGSWLQRTGTTTSPQHRMVWTVDDLIFYGWSLWLVQRDDAGAIVDAARCPIEWWRFGEDGAILVNGNPVPAASALLIPGFHEGIVHANPRTIRGARELEVQWAARAANPIPAVELHQTSNEILQDDEIAAMLADWQAALTATGGALGFTPLSVELRTHGDADGNLLVEGRNAAAIDAARILGLPAAMIDASNVNSTLTYETMSGRSLQYVDQSLSLYLGPIEARFSLDDVTPAGTRVRADTSAITINPPSPVGALTVD